MAARTENRFTGGGRVTPDIHAIDLTASTATVALAAKARGVDPGRSAKTLSLRVGGVSPLGRTRPLRVYRGNSLKDFDEVLPAAGRSMPPCGFAQTGLPR